MSLSDPLMVKDGFISPFRTTLRWHLGKTSSVRRCRILSRLMMLWMVSSCMVVGGFDILMTLAIEEQCTLIVFTCLFSAKRWTSYSANVTYERSLDGIPLSFAHLEKAFHWELYTFLDESLRVGSHFHYGFGEVVLSEDIPDKSHTARFNRRGSLWNWGRQMLGMYWYRATSVSGMEGRGLSWSSRGCHGQDGCCEAMRITVVPW